MAYVNEASRRDLQRENNCIIDLGGVAFSGIINQADIQASRLCLLSLSHARKLDWQSYFGAGDAGTCIN